MKIIAVDFDGCLCENKYPFIGNPHCEVIDMLIDLQMNGAKLILWTCRSGTHLKMAVEWCRFHGVTFDAVNANLPENIEKYGNDCRKINADFYIDDRNLDIERLWTLLRTKYKRREK